MVVAVRAAIPVVAEADRVETPVAAIMEAGTGNERSSQLASISFLPIGSAPFSGGRAVFFVRGQPAFFRASDNEYYVNF